MNAMSRLRRLAPKVLVVAAALTALPVAASAAVTKDGAWPADEKKVSFEFDGKPSEGVKKLASEAGWSLVVAQSADVDAHDVHVDVRDQPADVVLEAIFAEANVVARRNGSLVTITPAAPAQAAPPAAPAPPPAAAPAPPAPPAAAPAPTVRGEDRSVVGHSLTIDRDEIVHTVTVTGGSVDVEGTVTGDLVVAGGSANIENGARVAGNVTVFGGSIDLEKGGRIDGDVGVVGGSFHREEGAIVGGKVVDSSHGQKGNVRVTYGEGGLSTSVTTDKSSKSSRITEKVHTFGQSMTKMSLLFVFGCVLLALATGRMERLRVEAAARPMRSFALGIVGALGGGLTLLAIALTIVGIPFAFLFATLGVLAVYASMASVLTTFGAAVLGHKTQNAYVHLLFGCVAFLLLGAIPYVGGFVTFAVTMVAVGALVATRGAGFLDGKKRRAELV